MTLEGFTTQDMEKWITIRVVGKRVNVPSALFISGSYGIPV